MGATDPSDATGRVLSALQKAEVRAHIDIVLGAAAPALARITSRSAADMTVHVEPADLPALAAAADLAIGAAGTSSFERAVLGLPAMMIPVADNQRLIAQGFASGGAAEVLPPEILDDPEALGVRITTLATDRSRRAAMSHAAASFTDGRGAARLLVAAAGSIPGEGGTTIRLRLAETEDEDWFLTLQRQPATRRYALNPQIPDSATHARWFAGILDDDERLLMVIEADGVAVGMVRLDRKPEARVIFDLSIAVDERRHGKRIASGALALVRRMAPGADLIATVLPENQASLALFAASGFHADGGNRYRSCAA
jgi:RimJ/RimL family protein N-acetyltransferase